jgi:DNA polymerase I
MGAVSRPRLFLIDSFGFIFRAYHARARTGAPPMRTSTGITTETVYIFHNMIRKLLTSYKPEYIAAVFESLGPTFRDTEFAEYKANREEMPQDLGEQVPYVRRMLEALRIPILEYANFEADDVIGTIAKKCAGSHADVVIVSSDKDMLQLVDDAVSMYNPMKDDVWYNPAKAEEFMGVKPSQVADLLALKGDAIDNIPGAPGIGDKGARDLIAKFGSVEEALNRAAEVERKMYRESLLNNRERIEMSKRLATIETNVPIDFAMEPLKAHAPDASALKQIYKELEFFSLLKELGPTEEAHTRDYQTLNSEETLEAWLASMPEDATLAFSLADAGEDSLGVSVAGLAWRLDEGRAVSLDLLRSSNRGLALLTSNHPKLAHDIKSILLKLAGSEIEANGFRHDVMLYSFLLCADPSGCSADTLAERYLDRRLMATPEQHAEAALAVWERLRPELEAQPALLKLYETIDLPLVAVLARMEREGIRIDPSQLRGLSARMDAEIQRLSLEICQMAGKSFNINSPQQLGKVLFEDLGLATPVKYGKGKQISTAADVLEGLAATHEIARKVLDYRQLTKLKGTYVDALPALINPDTGRLHTTYNQIGAATGRLSSSNPNLQNIPIRTELGREIRAAFVPREGWRLVVADYSQIELRLLAHFSQDPVLTEAFRNGEDIHTRTAAEVFNVSPMMVTPDMRRDAKAVNFGIVYGQTPFGLAQQIGVDRKEAERYIRAYFERYSGVKRFIDATIQEVRQTGVSVTLLGRRRPIPDMNSRNPNARGFAERTAVNTPLQGTAADLIKLAMIRIDRLIRERGFHAKMLLQVHDELLLEAPPDELESIRDLVRTEMGQVYELAVPLVVDIGIGENWRDAK